MTWDIVWALKNIWWMLNNDLGKHSTKISTLLFIFSEERYKAYSFLQ